MPLCVSAAGTGLVRTRKRFGGSGGARRRASSGTRAPRLTADAARADNAPPVNELQKPARHDSKGGPVRSPAQWCVGFVAVAAMALAAGSPFTAPIVAQAVLAQLGLTEASARSFLSEEMKSEPAAADRRKGIFLAGHRAFYKLPPAVRGPAATALFAWAKAHVSSPAFKTAYAQYRKEAGPVDERPGPSAEAQAAEMKANQEMVRKIAESLPPAEREKLLAQLKEQEAQMAETRARTRKILEAAEAERKAQDQARANEFEIKFPADPNRLVARRLRAFLDEPADADFTARIIRLTDGPDGMEFIAPAHRAKSVTWQLAVLAGPEATKAARAAADAWLKEVAP